MGGGGALTGLAAEVQLAQKSKTIYYINWLNKKRAPAVLESLHSTERILSQAAPRTLFRLDMATEFNYLTRNF
jgi:hypothetical protein